MAAPRTDWQEQIAPDEEARFAAYAQAFAQAQQARNRKQGAGRALHRKQLVAVKGQLQVLPDLPEWAAQGVFAQPGHYKAWVRLSNGGADKLADARPDIRGFSIKALGVSGPGALGGTASSQDFLLINHPAFSFATADAFVGVALAAMQGPAKLLAHLVRQHGVLGGLKQLAKLAGNVGKPFSGFATEHFYSAAPLANGPYAVRVRLLPARQQARPLAQAKADWGADFVAQLATGEMRFALQLQGFVDEARTPIENPTIDWPESVSPYVTVAHLVLPVQGADAAFQAQAEAARFDIWGGLAAHRPLGQIMRARKAAYYASQQGRGVA